MTDQNNNSGGVIVEPENDEVLNSNRLGTNVSAKKLMLFFAVAVMAIAASVFGGFTYIKNQFGWDNNQPESYKTRRSYEQAPETIGQYVEPPLIVEEPPIEEEIEVVEEPPIEVVEEPPIVLENQPPIIIEPEILPVEPESNEPTLTDRRLSSTINSYNAIDKPDKTIPNLQVKLMNGIDYMLVKGTKIPCVMESNIISEQSGYTSCVVSQDVYSANARILLIEKGTKVTGEYQSDVNNGDRRLEIIWDRLITPYDIVVQLNSPTTDRLGAAGVTGEVDNRWGLRVGSALLVSLMSDAISIAGDRTEKGSNSQVFVESETSDTSQRLAEKILDKNIDLNPIIYIREGEMINIYVADDIDLSEVYSVKDYASTSNNIHVRPDASRYYK